MPRRISYFNDGNWITSTSLTFLFFWLVLMVGGRSRFFSDPGSLWHIVVGNKIFDQGLIYADTFSFTQAGQPWIAQWWLGDCILAGLSRLGGLDLILWATAATLAVFFAWLHRRFVKEGMDPLLALFLTVLTLASCSYHLHPRPHLVTIIMIAWTQAQLIDFEADRIRLRRLFWLVPLYVLWANIHGGLLGGLALLIVSGLGWFTFGILGRQTPLAYAKQWLSYLSLVVLCGLAALVNPYGSELPRVWFALLTSPVLPRLIEEHGPLISSGTAAWLILLQAVVFVIFLTGVSPRHWRVTWLLPFLWLLLTWSRIRYGPLFAVSSALAMAQMYPQVNWVSWFSKRGSKVFTLRARGEPLAWKALVAPGVLVLTAAFLKATGTPVPILGSGWARLDPAHWPVALLPELKEFERSHPDGTPIFNDMLYGGYLIYETPKLRVFIDDRCELYGDEGLLDYAHAYFDDPAKLESWQGHYGFELALVAAGSHIDHYLKTAPRWELVRQAGPATLYRHRDP